MVALAVTHPPLKLQKLQVRKTFCENQRIDFFENGTAPIRHQMQENSCLKLPQMSINSGIEKMNKFKYGLQL